MRHYGYGYRRDGARKALGRLALLLLLLALVVAAAFGVRRMQGLLRELAVARVSNSVSRVISEAVGDAIADGSFQYDRMIAFETDKEGRITAVKSNMTEFNRLQTVVLDEVLARISEVSTRELGIPIDQVAVFGDSENDLAMIESVPNSVAVANASQAVRDAARWHIGPAADDSVADALLQIADSAARGEDPAFMR